MARRDAGHRAPGEAAPPAPGSPCSNRPTAGATKPSPPTPPGASSASWRPGTAPTPESRTASASPSTPAWDGFPSREFTINQGLDPDRGDRRRPHLLAAADRPRRRPCHCRTQDAEVPHAARPRPTDPRQPTTPAPDSEPLALGQPDRCRLRDHPGHPRTHLTQQPNPSALDQEPTVETRTGAPTGPPPRADTEPPVATPTKINNVRYRLSRE
jgi:hypothetical protein